MALNEKKIPAGAKADEALAEQIRAGVLAGRFPARKPLPPAEAGRVPPLKIGKTANVLGIHLSHCQISYSAIPAMPRDGLRAPASARLRMDSRRRSSAKPAVKAR